MMKRIKPLLMSSWVLLVGGSSLLAASLARPNVLFVAVDDLNDWIGVLGGNLQSITPNIDRLARRGVLFTNTHCAAPACNPSRAALLTGIPPFRSGVYHNRDPWRLALPDAITIPQYLARHGYWTAGSGKIFHDRFPDPASWHEFYPAKDRQRFTDPTPARKPKDGLNGLNKQHFDWGPLDQSDAAMGDSKTVDWICDQLRRKHDRPFFLACGLFRPHLPWYVPKKYFDRYPADSLRVPIVPDKDLADVPPAGLRMARPQGDHAAVTKAGEWPKAVQGYLASIAFADAQIGRLLDAFDQSAYRGNTILVFWTDHGWHLGEKKHWRKFTLWEEATRVPMIWIVPKGFPSLPGGTGKNQRCDAPASLMDIYPTLIALCALSPRDDIAGRSLVPLLKAPATHWDRAVVTTFGRNNHAVRNHRWRYIHYADGSEELYDHWTDPMEWKNLAGDPLFFPVKRRLAAWLPRVNVPEVSRTN